VAVWRVRATVACRRLFSGVERAHDKVVGDAEAVDLRI
jgi:hypothetical protein